MVDNNREVGVVKVYPAATIPCTHEGSDTTSALSPSLKIKWQHGIRDVEIFRCKTQSADAFLTTSQLQGMSD